MPHMHATRKNDWTGVMFALGKRSLHVGDITVLSQEAPFIEFEYLSCSFGHFSSARLKLQRLHVKILNVYVSITCKTERFHCSLIYKATTRAYHTLSI